MTLDFSVVIRNLPLFIQGLFVTMGFALATVVLGVLIGIPLALARLSKSRWISTPATSYIEVIRGTPLLLQLYLIAYGIPLAFNLNIPLLAAGIMALAVNSSAYVAEIIRAGIQAVDKGQVEASRSLGLSYWQTMRLVVIPQAVKNVLPAIGNEFVTIVKESSIVSIIGIMDLMHITDIIKTQTLRVFEALIVAAFLYFLVTYSISTLLRKLEARWKANA